MALGAGTPYLYSFFAPQLMAKCQIPISQASNLALALNIGSSLLGLPAGMIADKSPRLSCFAGAVCTFTAYLILCVCYHSEISNVLLVELALGLIGFGSVLGYYASVKCCTVNFPNYKGVAGAFPVSLYGLSGMFFALVCNKLFGDNIETVFKFLMWCCSSMILLGAMTLEVFELHEYKTIDEPPIDIENGLQPPVHIDKLTDSGMIANTDATVGHSEEAIMSPRPRSSYTGTPKETLSVEPKIAFEEHKLETSASEKPLLRTILQPKFITYYIIFAMLQGIGKMYIFSVGFIVDTQVNSPPLNKFNFDADGLQSLQVSLISMFSFAGRISAGLISDLLVKKFKAQRIWTILLAASIMLCASIHLLEKKTIPDDMQDMKALKGIFTIVSTASVMFGYAFGILFGSFPSIISDSFGSKGFSTIWGLMTTGGLITVKIFISILGNEMTSKTVTGEASCLKGVYCYTNTFHVNSLCSIISIVMTLICIAIPYYRRNRKIGTSTMDESFIMGAIQE